MSIRIVYLSTPEFGVPTLRAMAADERFDLVGVVTQPDKSAGRGLKLNPPPVKVAAEKLGLRVLQPASLRTPEAIAAVAGLQPDVIAVAAYGQWIPAEVFDMPPKRSLNLHPSLLPRHRGAAPVMSAILAGDTEVGLTVLFVEDEMDAGDIFAQMSVPIGPEATTISVMEQLAELAPPFFLNVLADWVAGAITPVPQDHSQSTWFDRIKKDIGLIDWSMSAVEIDRRCRALTPWPGIYTFFEGNRLQIHKSKPLLTDDAPANQEELSMDDVMALSAAEPGTVVAIEQGVAIATGDGALRVDVLQLQGRRALDIGEFIRGQRTFVGSTLG
jgi:methionyl-tRNA formyltransferase